ncbi:MAG: hypothetical protein K6F79_05290 [Saccharofermentans sp.]|nr:hypothetical protein [Saccharofermentans sp.]
MSNTTNEEIVYNHTFYGDDGMLIEFYGSDDVHDALQMVNYCNRWLEENEDSVVAQESMRIVIEIYNDKPDQGNRDCLEYNFRIGNFAETFRNEISDQIDCLDINRANDFCVSVFEGYDLQHIRIPSNTVIDDFDVFIDMSRLRRLIVSDGPFTVDTQAIEDKYQELIDHYNTYDELPFECMKSPA